MMRYVISWLRLQPGRKSNVPKSTARKHRSSAMIRERSGSVDTAVNCRREHPYSVVTDVITTSASQRTRVDFSVSNQKARDEGGRDENCRLRSTRKTTNHSHGGHRKRRVHREDACSRRECSTRVLCSSGRWSGRGHRSHRGDAVVSGIAGRVGYRG